MSSAQRGRSTSAPISSRQASASTPTSAATTTTAPTATATTATTATAATAAAATTATASSAAPASTADPTPTSAPATAPSSTASPPTSPTSSPSATTTTLAPLALAELGGKGGTQASITSAKVGDKIGDCSKGGQIGEQVRQHEAAKLGCGRRGVASNDSIVQGLSGFAVAKMLELS
ncbi:unnamed protein product [Closterium sp. Yama58-4]|nr:unnamed protein product [Closterium sp. Yama58-4]